MPSRRAVLGMMLAGSLAGCFGDDGDTDEDDYGDGVEYEGPMVGATELRHNYPVVLEDPGNGDRVVEVHWHGEGGEWHFQPLALAVGETRSLAIRLYDHERDRLPLTGADDYGFSATGIDDAAPVALTIEEETVTFEGREAGEAEIRFAVSHPDGGTWTTPPLRVVVEE